MAEWNQTLTPNFSVREMGCKCDSCDGRASMDGDFMAKLQALRDRVGPLTVTSGYRCLRHPSEIKKVTPGAHTAGRAADIAVDGPRRYEILRHVHELGFVGIGFGKTFIHLDDGHPSPGVLRPTSWTY